MPVVISPVVFTLKSRMDFKSPVRHVRQEGVSPIGDTVAGAVAACVACGIRARVHRSACPRPFLPVE